MQIKAALVKCVQRAGFSSVPFSLQEKGGKKGFFGFFSPLKHKAYLTKQILYTSPHYWKLTWILPTNWVRSSSGPHVFSNLRGIQNKSIKYKIKQMRSLRVDSNMFAFHYARTWAGLQGGLGWGVWQLWQSLPASACTPVKPNSEISGNLCSKLLLFCSLLLHW